MLIQCFSVEFNLQLTVLHLEYLLLARLSICYIIGQRPFENDSNILEAVLFKNRISVECFGVRFSKLPKTFWDRKLFLKLNFYQMTL